MGLDVCFNSQSTLRPMIFDILRLSTYGTGPRKLESSVKHVGCCWPVAAIGADLVDQKFRSLSTGVSAQNLVRISKWNKFLVLNIRLEFGPLGGWFYTCSNNTWPLSSTVHKQALSRRIYEPMSHFRDTWCTQKPCLHLSLNHIACCRWHSFMYHY